MRKIDVIFEKIMLRRPLEVEELEWLVSRIQELEHALEYYDQATWVARRALAKDSDTILTSTIKATTCEK